MQKPTQLGDFNDLVHSTINVLEDRVAELENRIVALEARIKALEPNKAFELPKAQEPKALEGQKTVAFKG